MPVQNYMTPQLSIIIASINGREYLEHCLDALGSQTYIFSRQAERS